ncbi:glycoside hydrolase 15-related protein [Beutenbergia cavernae DSM 12333]|uniref:Glycoside hydrolase 15-related protein n=1 Tax=Beutenbergia cavernae (strain ATCC BAA-8 / DSM 12333 / CCUG 43141 / JCM 11478 / NBRC 16432 / NCIMB 13614 / HKI 0122) TaxID=471853 RepID=C5BZA6_BEUC1|nr:glycoside hydrolase 15-like protein [Beutenbergia cavernae]ACQ79078.1 glycoside hydrolase 15-related protein [Beutenbergia cavernae DSM 12333]
MLQRRPRHGRRVPLLALGVVAVAVVAVVATVAVAPGVRWPWEPRFRMPELAGEGLAVVWDASGELTPEPDVAVVPAGDEVTFLPGTHVTDPGAEAPTAVRAAAEEAAAEQRAWLGAGAIPGEGGEYEDMTRDALLDLHLLTHPAGAASGAPIAAPQGPWHYVWPRDAAFVAAAFGRTGHVADAVAALEFLQGVQHEDGSFEARYLTDGSGPPDDRGTQSDSTGWVLWALAEVLQAAPETPAGGTPTRADVLADLGPLLSRTAAYAFTLTDSDDRLPPPSMDYWEHRESGLTLGIAAPVLAGLESLARIRTLAGDDGGAAAAAARATEVRDAVELAFAPDGWPRYLGGGARDAATAFALPPFQPTALAGAEDAWAASIELMQRPAGGLAPGESWRDPYHSWTPQTSLYALAAASNGHDDDARAWLTWLDEHRTATGSIPEKVDANGRPVEVAPLAWSSAVAILAVDALDDASR